MTEVVLRNGSQATLKGRGIFGGILVGQAGGRPISWHPSGRHRWDDEHHANDIVAGLPDPLPKNIVID